jgi:hypothetical protein
MTSSFTPAFFTPFGWCIFLIFALTVCGLPIGLSMLGASIVYLMMAGLDIGLAAEQLLQGLTNTYTLLAIPLSWWPRACQRCFVFDLFRYVWLSRC